MLIKNNNLHCSETQGPSQPKKKLLILLTVVDTAYLLRHQIPYLAKRYEIVLVFGKGNNPASLASLKLFAKLVTIPIVREINPWRDTISLLVLIWLIIKEKPDLMHSYTPKAGLIGAVAGVITGLRSRVHSFTGLVFPMAHGFKRLICKSSDQIILNLTTHAIAESTGVQRDLYTISSRKTYLLGKGSICGVDTNHFRRHKVKAQSSEFRGIYIGRLASDKGISFLLEAHKCINSKSNRKFHLSLVGNIDLRDPISREDIEYIKNTRFVSHYSHQDDIRPFLEDTDILILPSLREGFPNILLESFSMGLPVIATRVPGSEEIVITNQTGWLVSPRSSSEIANAVIQASTLNPQKLIDMGLECRKMVEQHFRYEQVNLYLSQFYDMISKTRY